MRLYEARLFFGGDVVREMRMRWGAVLEDSLRMAEPIKAYDDALT